jgi:hypothetical protein
MSLLLIIIKIIIGTLVAIFAYQVGIKAIDSLGLEKHLKAKHWQYSISQLGELILLASIIAAIVFAVKLVNYLGNLLNLN